MELGGREDWEELTESKLNHPKHFPASIASNFSFAGLCLLDQRVNLLFVTSKESMFLLLVHFTSTLVALRIRSTHCNVVYVVIVTRADP